MHAAEIARRFGLGRGARLSEGPVARGKQGEVWRLETSDGLWAVKVPFRPPGEEDVRAAAAFQEAAYAAGVPTPAVRRTVDGSVLADVVGRRLLVSTWVDLLPPDPGLDAGLVGATVAAVHRVPEPGPPGSTPGTGTVDPWFSEPVGAPGWAELCDALTAAGAPFADRLTAVRDDLAAVEAWCEPPSVVRTCHRDLWADNVRPTADGGICVIDWENAGPADPSQELACAVFEFCRSDPGRVRTLLAGYRAAGGPGTLDRPGHFSMLIAQLGHLTELAGRQWLAAADGSVERAEAERSVLEALDEPHTAPVLERLLRARLPV